MLLHCLAEDVKVKLSLHVCESDRFGYFCNRNGKNFIRLSSEKPDEVRHRSRVAIQLLSALVATSKFVLAAHYDIIITSRLATNI